MARIALSESSPNCLRFAVTLTAAASGNPSAEATASAKRRSTRVGGTGATSGEASTATPLDMAVSADATQLPTVLIAQVGAAAPPDSEEEFTRECPPAPTLISCEAVGGLRSDANGFPMECWAPLATGTMQAEATDLTAAPIKASGGSQKKPKPPCTSVPPGARAANMRSTVARPWTNVCTNSDSSCAVSQVADTIMSSLSLARRTLNGTPARSIR
mmetsp:Transcript_5468/g.13489  ORF Transcript_5468/g.13489 Transcript_5468/m.13489 type:complete len:216 (-) Transcript_5468:118-765(-)